MYGIFTYIWLILMVNVVKYTIHGSNGFQPIHLTGCGGVLPTSSFQQSRLNANLTDGPGRIVADLGLPRMWFPSNSWIDLPGEPYNITITHIFFIILSNKTTTQEISLKSWKPVIGIWTNDLRSDGDPIRFQINTWILDKSSLNHSEEHRRGGILPESLCT